MRGAFDHPLFGRVEFETEHTPPIFGDPIVSIKGANFDSDDVVPADIPQLKNVSHGKNGHPQLYRKAHAQFRAAFQLIESQGLLGQLKRVSTYNARLRKPISKKISKLPSNHSFGTAMDLNPNDPGAGASAAVFAPIFLSLGFIWGRNFPSPDPMHFEIGEFLSEEHIQEIVARG